MEIYIIILLFIIVTGYIFCVYINTSKSNIIFLYVNGIFFVLISSLRYGIGYDYKTYENIFNTIKNKNLISLFTIYKKEFGFVLLNKFISIIGGNHTIFLFFINIIINFIVMRFIYKYSKYPFISVYLYVALQYLSHSMNLVRQSMSVAIFIIAYTYIVECNFVKYCLIILIGSTFHISILILIPFYFLLVKKITPKSLFLIFSTTAIIYIFFDNIFILFSHFFKIYDYYSDSIYWQSNSIKYIIFPFVYVTFVLFYYKSIKNKNITQTILANSAVYYFCFSFFITKHFIIERFSIYFSIFSILIIPDAINAILSSTSISKTKKCIATLTVIAVSTTYFMFAVNQGFHNVYPYRSIFDRILLTSYITP